MVARRRGSILIATLLLLSLLLVAGLGLHGAQAQRYRGAAALGRQTAALALAEAGLEDARVKLEKDPLFPPRGAPEQAVFRYSEDLGAGSYTVTVDRTFAGPPHFLLVVRAQGRAGSRDETETRVTLVAEMDQAVEVRGGSGPNPAYFTWRSIRREE